MVSPHFLLGQKKWWGRHLRSISECGRNLGGKCSVLLVVLCVCVWQKDPAVNCHAWPVSIKVFYSLLLFSKCALSINSNVWYKIIYKKNTMLCMLFALYIISCFQLITCGAQGIDSKVNLCICAHHSWERNHKRLNLSIYSIAVADKGRLHAGECAFLRRDSTQLKSRNQTGSVHWIGVWDLG